MHVTATDSIGAQQFHTSGCKLPDNYFNQHAHNIDQVLIEYMHGANNFLHMKQSRNTWWNSMEVAVQKNSTLRHWPTNMQIFCVITFTDSRKENF